MEQTQKLLDFLIVTYGEHICTPVPVPTNTPPIGLFLEEQGGLAVGTRETQAKGSEFKACLSYKVNSGPA